MKDFDKILVCPTCRKELQTVGDLRCNTCDRIYPIKANKYYFTKSDIVIPDKLDKFKSYLKRFAGLYHFLIAVLSPVYISFHLKRFLRKELQQLIWEAEIPRFRRI
jgi:hypothetical protein